MAVVAAAFAYRQLMHARQVREDQTRPYVVVEIRPSGNRLEDFDIVVENVGTTPAYDLRIHTEPPLERSVEHAIAEHVDKNVALSDSYIFSRRIPVLAPNRPISVFFDNMEHRTIARRDLPDEYQATLVYYNRPTGNQRTEYNETTTVSAMAWGATVQVIPYSLRDVAKQLEAINTTLTAGNDHTDAP